jgi:hypothetical protein
MAKTQKQRSAEFRSRKAQTPEVRGIYAPPELHTLLREHVSGTYWDDPSRIVTVATKRAKRKA